ncbi:MAG: chromosomal replication initiator protein DnaA, partial [Bacilli bacterium]|nr:chromosomal replication initiator protein DnaA [Bacilli bacterium]
VGESNFFAHAAAVSVAENPGKAYNPLFIYGNSGLGKTHLMHAIGNHIVRNTNKKVLYVTSEKFVSDFLNLTKRDSNGTNYDYIEFFKDKYRNIDVLIIDDIQMLSGAPASQQEFFHTFNDLYDDNKQIIISSDRSPDDLKLLEERLITRFNWGLKVNIYPPDYELRMDILKKKMGNTELGKPITNEVLEYIANNFQADVRQLEGALTRIYAYSTMFNVPEINLDVAIEALKDYLNRSMALKNDINRIQKIVAEFYKVRVEDLKSNRRNSNIVYPRQIAMYLSRKLTDESFIRIGMEFGGKNHSTVIHACEKIEKDIRSNNDIKNIVNNLIKQIR